jgi:hypothetical protein
MFMLTDLRRRRCKLRFLASILNVPLITGAQELCLRAGFTMSKHRYASSAVDKYAYR